LVALDRFPFQQPRKEMSQDRREQYRHSTRLRWIQPNIFFRNDGKSFDVIFNRRKKKNVNVGLVFFNEKP
jgi:hypothetical protein